MENLSAIADRYLTNRLSVGEDVGTHIGAPTHFEAGGKTVDQLDLADLMQLEVSNASRDRTSAARIGGGPTVDRPLARQKGEI